ncbi:hypothetical protein PG994_006926 [Apiospora phragmitis]|uniref:Uncharacterized protein n=1 Tax=Apiospora phragmitis TaxID=2905665 RepID=A0ABR1VJB4_9PEZI
MLANWGDDLTSLMKNAWRGLGIQDPNHLSRVLHTAWGAEKPSQVRAGGVLDIEATKSRFDASALTFRDQIWRLGRSEYSTPNQTLGGMQTDLLLALMKQNRTMGRIHERLLHDDGLRSVLREIKIGSSSWWVPGQGGLGWGDYETEVESSVRTMDWLVGEWNTMRDADMAIAMYLRTSAAGMDSQCVWCLLEEDEEAKRAAETEPK